MLVSLPIITTNGYTAVGVQLGGGTTGDLTSEISDDLTDHFAHNYTHIQATPGMIRLITFTKFITTPFKGNYHGTFLHIGYIS